MSSNYSVPTIQPYHKRYQSQYDHRIKRMGHINSCYYRNSESHLSGMVPGNTAKFEYLGGLYSAPRVTHGKCPPSDIKPSERFTPKDLLLYNAPGSHVNFVGSSKTTRLSDLEKKWFGVYQMPDTQPTMSLEDEKARLEIINMKIAIFEKLGGLDERDKVLFKELVGYGVTGKMRWVICVA